MISSEGRQIIQKEVETFFNNKTRLKAQVDAFKGRTASRKT